MGITRRHFVSKLVIGIAGSPFIRGLSWAQTKGKLGYMKIVDNAAMFVAMEKGFFKTEGLELETVPMAGGAVILQGVTSGDLQIGWSNVISLYQAHVEGFDFKLIAGGATNVKAKGESHAIQVLKASPIKGAKDLEGKTVGAPTIWMHSAGQAVWHIRQATHFMRPTSSFLRRCSPRYPLRGTWTSSG